MTLESDAFLMFSLLIIFAWLMFLAAKNAFRRSDPEVPILFDALHAIRGIVTKDKYQDSTAIKDEINEVLDRTHEQIREMREKKPPGEDVKWMYDAYGDKKRE